MRHPVGTVYLLHFTPGRYQHAGHYLGWTDNLEQRLATHRAGKGARLLAVIMQAGYSFDLARTWTGTRERERQLKKQCGAARFCPICKGYMPSGAFDWLKPRTDTLEAPGLPFDQTQERN